MHQPEILENLPGRTSRREPAKPALECLGEVDSNRSSRAVRRRPNPRRRDMKRVFILVAIAGILGIAGTPPASAQVIQTPLNRRGHPEVRQQPAACSSSLRTKRRQGRHPGGARERADHPQHLRVQVADPADRNPRHVHRPAGPTETIVWGYQIGDICQPFPKHSYIGPVVVAERGTPTQMTFINQLGNRGTAMSPPTPRTPIRPCTGPTRSTARSTSARRICPVGDAPVGECAEQLLGPIGAAVHLHGGEIPPNLDGGPDSWFTFDGAYRGHGFYTREVDDIS